MELLELTNGFSNMKAVVVLAGTRVMVMSVRGQTAGQSGLKENRDGQIGIKTTLWENFPRKGRKEMKQRLGR